MKELIENIRFTSDNWGELFAILLNTLSLLCIVIGVFSSMVQGYKNTRQPGGGHPMHAHFRIIFGGWLVVALEFQLAADIVGTIISPTLEHVIELGAIALIRIFLNYFLIRELKEERESLLIEEEIKAKEEIVPP